MREAAVGIRGLAILALLIAIGLAMPPWADSPARAQSVTTTITGVTAPTYTAVDEVINKVFVANSTGTTITVVNTTNNTTSTISLSKTPKGVDANTSTH